MKANAPAEILQGDDGKHYVVVQQDGVEGPICVELSDEQYEALQNDNTELQIDHSGIVVEQADITEEQLQYTQDDLQFQDQSQSIQDELQDSVVELEQNPEQNVEAGVVDWFEDQLGKESSESQDKSETDVVMEENDSSKNIPTPSTPNYMNKPNTPRTFSDVFQEQMIQSKKPLIFGKGSLKSSQEVPAKRQRINKQNNKNPPKSTKEKNGWFHDKPKAYVSNAKIQNTPIGRGTHAGMYQNIINRTPEKEPKKNFTTGQVTMTKYVPPQATAKREKISIQSVVNISPVINKHTVVTRIAKDDKNPKLSNTQTESPAGTQKHLTIAPKRSKTARAVKNSSASEWDSSEDVAQKSILDRKEIDSSAINDSVGVGSSTTFSRSRLFEPKDKDLSAFNDDDSVGSSGELSYNTYEEEVQLLRNRTLSGYDTDDFLHDDDQLSTSSDEEECEFSVDVRRERASEFFPLLGADASELLLNEHDRLENRMATLSKERSEVKNELRITVEEVKQLRNKLQALDKRLEQV